MAVERTDGLARIEGSAASGIFNLQFVESEAGLFLLDANLRLSMSIGLRGVGRRAQPAGDLGRDARSATGPTASIPTAWA